MAGIDLGEHDPALRLGHRVALEARRRGAIIRPLGDVVVLMPPLAISKRELRRLVEITAESIEAACAEAYRGEPLREAAGGPRASGLSATPARRRPCLAVAAPILAVMKAGSAP